MHETKLKSITIVKMSNLVMKTLFLKTTKNNNQEENHFSMTLNHQYFEGEAYKFAKLYTSSPTAH